MRDLYGLPHGASDLAEPLITPEEAQHAEPAICRHHNGLIAQHLAAGDFVGKAYFCPVGRMFWRLAERQAGMYRPLKFPRGL